MKYYPLLPLAALSLSGCMEAAPPVPQPDYEQITWTEALTLLAECKVDTVNQNHNLDVLLVTKDGSWKQTREPGLDDIFYAVDAHPECGEVLVITE